MQADTSRFLLPVSIMMSLWMLSMPEELADFRGGWRLFPAESPDLDCDFGLWRSCTAGGRAPAVCDCLGSNIYHLPLGRLLKLLLLMGDVPRDILFWDTAHCPD